MERRNVLAGVAVLVMSLFMVSGTAFAHATHHKAAKPRRQTGGGPAPETCVVHALPSSFMDQGEFGSASSVADVIEVECEEVYAEKTVRISANELYSRCDKKLYWKGPYAYPWSSSQASYTAELDNDGNATVVVMGGPSCAAGESLVAAHLEVAPYTTVTTGFTVLPPRPTAPGVYVTPANKVEGENYSDVATIVQVEFPPVFAEEPVNINAAQLYARCHLDPKLVWYKMGENGPEVIAEKSGEEKSEEVVEKIFLDNDGNAFAVLIGGGSCASGTSLIEASLEHAPYTTYTANFTIEPPRPTFPE
jgi:hypothetical protein